MSLTTQQTRQRLGRTAAYGMTGVLLLFAFAEAWIVFPPAIANGVTLGMDLRIYVDHAERWLADGTFYQAVQTSGPYDIDALVGAVYPPVILYLLVPFVWGVPWALWWLIPLGIIAAAVVAARPAWWQLPILAFILVYPRTWTIIVLGNPAMWAMAFLAAGLIWTWPTPFAALKLTLAPFALIGLHRRTWWAGVALGLVLALPLLPMWPDFVAAVLNARSERGVDYVLGEWPIALLLVAGLLGRRRQSMASADRRSPQGIANDPLTAR